MKYYSNWQDALMDFIASYGHNYKDAYNLMMEFEALLQQNIKGTYFIRLGEKCE